MGVKSTITLTRDEAERRYLDLWLRDIAEQMRPGLASIDDTTLEDRLMLMNDKAAGGEGFENYHISYDPIE